MALATRCPACSTVFRITTAQAAAKGGMVRCGHCHHVFNSLDALVRVEDLEIIDESSVATAPVEPAPGAPVATVAPDADADAEEFRQSEISSVLAGLSTPTDPDAKIEEWWMPVQRPGRRAARAPAPAVATTAESPSALSTRPRETLSGTDAVPRTGSIGDVLMHRPEPLETSPATARWTWGALSLVVALLLAGQIAYLWRDELAVGWPAARPWLVAACRPLSCVVDYPARPDAVTIESATVQTAATGLNLYLLTALLRNRDATDIRYPHLELTLTDTNDRPVLRRVLRPEDYLAPLRAGGERVGPAFAAQSELPVRVTFELNNLRFAGYRLDRFYP